MQFKLLWWFKAIQNESNNLLAGDKLMPEMHLRKPGFTYIVCGASTKNKDLFIKTN